MLPQTLDIPVVIVVESIDVNGRRWSRRMCRNCVLKLPLPDIVEGHDAEQLLTGLDRCPTSTNLRPTIDSPAPNPGVPRFKPSLVQRSLAASAAAAGLPRKLAGRAPAMKHCR